MRIGVLGGAFDPPHAAHAALAEAARRQLNLDLILWVPTFAPPHKGGAVASFAARTAMVRALISEGQGPENQAPPASDVSDIEATLPHPSYTLHTLRALKKSHAAGTDWYLILGADNWAGFPRWHQPEAVLAEAALAVYPRTGFSPTPDARLPPAVMLNFPEMPDQSTEFREALASTRARREDALETLPRPVATYIRAHHLYLAGVQG
jgi:nicotinate-nucleotide adenylyltransferase